MAEQKKVIECPCGAVLEGEGDDAVVAVSPQHASETHDMALSREHALEMARPA
jgi:hypothetical protein